MDKEYVLKFIDSRINYWFDMVNDNPSLTNKIFLSELKDIKKVVKEALKTGI